MARFKCPKCGEIVSRRKAECYPENMTEKKDLLSICATTGKMETLKRIKAKGAKKKGEGQ